MKWRRYSSSSRVVSRSNFPEDIEAFVPVTVVEDKVLYRIVPDGHRIKIKDLQPAKPVYKRVHIFNIKAAS